MAAARAAMRWGSEGVRPLASGVQHESQPRSTHVRVSRLLPSQLDEHHRGLNFPQPPCPSRSAPTCHSQRPQSSAQLPQTRGASSALARLWSMLCPRHADPSADTPAILRNQLDAQAFERRRDRLQRCGLWVSSPPLGVDQGA